MKLLGVGLLLACLLVGGPTATWAAEAKAKAPVETKAEKPAAVNINSADAKQLSTLPGIGKVTAENMVAYRQANGAFAKAEDLLRVKGIGDKTLAKIRPFIVLQ